MAIGYAFAMATISQQIISVQEAVNGAFKPLISTACEMPQRLDAEEAFRRCTSIAGWSQKIEDTAKQGMSHLETLRNDELDIDKVPSEFLPHLDSLAKSCRGAKRHLLEMFSEAEKSPMWQAHIYMLRPLKMKFIRALTATENIAIQIAIEVREREHNPVESRDSHVTHGEATELLLASHKMLGAEAPKWM
uniref:hypothetical protein n=1 Tax=Serratia quinivorans TaxID=137545 RepID=UPI0035C6E0FB